MQAAFYTPCMPHVIETASSGRAKCRGCDARIAKGEDRFGERTPNPFGDGDMTLWFHLCCAAYKRPEPLLETLDDGIDNADALRAAAAFTLAHPRLDRLGGAERAPTGRARCRHCREMIADKSWRLPLGFFEEFRFQPSGFIHAHCAPDYFGTSELGDRLVHFSPELTPADLAELQACFDDAR